MDPDKIQGNIQRPYGQNEPEQSDKIDPEKFKRVMKVEDTDESQKRNKRNLKKEEEEGDEETEGKVETPPPTSNAFSEFMSDKDDLQNVLDSESGGVRYRSAPDESESFVAPQPGSINTEGVELDEEPSPSMPQSQAPQSQLPPQSQAPSQEQTPQAPQPQTGGQQGSGAPPPSEESGISPQFYEGDFQEEPYPPQTGIPSQSTSDQNVPTNQSTSEAQTPQQAGEKPKDKEDEKSSKKGEDSSLLASQPKMSDLIPKGKKKTAQKPSAEIKTLPEGMKTPNEKQKGDDVSGLGKVSGKEETPAVTFRRMTPQEVRKERLEKGADQSAAGLEGIGVPPAKAGAEGESGKDKKDDDDVPEANAANASITLPIFPTPIQASSPTEATPAYTKLSPEVHELFEKMGGVMMVQVDKGVTTTTMDINMPNSVFNGAQVILDQYSTAPHSYNVQLIGSAEAVKAFSENLDGLKSAFAEGRFNFEVNILTPSIGKPKKSPHLIRRKGSAGGKGGSGSKK